MSRPQSRDGFGVLGFADIGIHLRIGSSWGQEARAA